MSNETTHPERIEEFLERGVTEIIGRDRLEERLRSGEKLRVKFGIDPTSPNIHLGRAVALLKLRDLQELGHQVVFIVGNFTGVIGDTSDKESERPMLTSETVAENMRSYLDQAGKLLDMSQVEVRYNAEWLEELGYREIGEQADAFSVAEFIARENIAKRLEAGKRVSLREMLYPLMQGYDSVVVKADVELGGSDQRFNILAGRKLQEHYGQAPQSVVLFNLILGTDGRKMSSSWGNTINLTDSANDMFGKVMSVPDELIGTYFVHCTRVPLGEVKRVMDEVWSGAGNPRDAKLRLAREIVTLYHGADTAAKEEEYFINTFSKHAIPEELEELRTVVGAKLADVLSEQGLASSKTDARRKMEQGGVELDGKKVTEYGYEIVPGDDGAVLRVGKKDFRKIVL